MPPHPIPMKGRMAKDPKKTLLRIISYLKKYIPILILVLICILVGAYAQIIGSTALGDLVDDFILPMVSSGTADYGPLTQFIFKIAGVFVLGIAASFFQSYLMVGVTQGTQKTIRDECSRKCSACPSATLTPTPQAISCLAIPATLTPCAR